MFYSVQLECLFAVQFFCLIYSISAHYVQVRRRKQRIYVIEHRHKNHTDDYTRYIMLLKSMLLCKNYFEKLT